MGFEVALTSWKSRHFATSTQNETQIQRPDHMLEQKGKLYHYVRLGSKTAVLNLHFVCSLKHQKVSVNLQE